VHGLRKSDAVLSSRLGRHDGPGAYVIVCKWCESGEPRPSQESIMAEDDRFWLDDDDESEDASERPGGDP
jgi:hypothetical protein